MFNDVFKFVDLSDAEVDAAEGRYGPLAEGRTVFVDARIAGDAGVAVEVDGIFIVPNWSV